MLVSALVIVGLLIILYIADCLLRPLRQVRGIPTIPFWVALLPLVQGVDQQHVFETYVAKPLRKYGAVKIFFAGQWNILVHSPEHMAEIFKREDVFQKSGNYKKIPHSVLSALLGDNIISGRGETWRLYRRVIKPGLQLDPDLDDMIDNARLLCNILAESQASGSGIQESIQRYTTANFAQIIFNVDFGTLRSQDAHLHRTQCLMKRAIFKPLFMNFPFLDQLKIPSRQRARLLASHFTDQLISALETAHEADVVEGPSELPRRLLAARNSGLLTEQQFRDNVTILFIAGQENPQLAVMSTLYLLAKNRDIQNQLFDELRPRARVDQESIETSPLLLSVIYESLRLLPPINQLINRRASTSTTLGDIPIPKGTYVGYNCYSTNTDPEVWEDADTFRPSRWGQSCQEIQKEYRRRRARAEFISFHGGQRACLGERFALVQLQVTLCVLVRRFRWGLDPAWRDRMTPAGPLCPHDLRLVFEER